MVHHLVKYLIFKLREEYIHNYYTKNLKKNLAGKLTVFRLLMAEVISKSVILTHPPTNVNAGKLIKVQLNQFSHFKNSQIINVTELDSMRRNKIYLELVKIKNFQTKVVINLMKCLPYKYDDWAHSSECLSPTVRLRAAAPPL